MRGKRRSFYDAAHQKNAAKPVPDFAARFFTVRFYFVSCCRAVPRVLDRSGLFHAPSRKTPVSFRSYGAADPEEYSNAYVITYFSGSSVP